MKKMKLESLRIKSFITIVNNSKLNTYKSGSIEIETTKAYDSIVICRSFLRVCGDTETPSCTDRSGTTTPQIDFTKTQTG